MGTFVSAYLVVWLAVVAYVGRMGIRQRALERKIDSLQQRLRPESNDRQTPAQAA